MSTLTERLKALAREKSITVRDLERIMKVSNGYVSKIKEEIGSKKIEYILSSFPDVNRAWLLTGEGDMLIEETNTEAETDTDVLSVLLLPISAQGGTLNDFVVSVKESDCERVVSPIRGADFAMTVSGDSMAPEYPSGSQIFIKKINEQAFIEWGKVYVLDTCNGSVIKILAPSDKEGFVKCLSINEDPKYASFEVEWNDIYGVYRVLLCMSLK